MGAFDDKYWNLAQVSAWVIYREKKLVEQMANAAPLSFGAMGAYTEMWPAGRSNEHGTLSELHSALISGQLIARGYPHDDQDRLAPIPEREWPDLHLKPPFAYRSSRLAEQHQPWLDIRLDSIVGCEPLI